MIKYITESQVMREFFGKKIYNFVKAEENSNIDVETVKSFGEEWIKFDHFEESEVELAKEVYFDVVTESMLNRDSIVMDMGCGTGRWTKYACKRAKFVEAIDPSDAVISAAKLLSAESNVRITQAEVSSIPFPDDSFDFVFSLGVLHHIPDTAQAMIDTVKKLKPGGHFLVYLYYKVEERSFLFRSIFFLSNILRNIVYRLPGSIKRFACDLLAIFIYLPFILLSKVIRAIFGEGAMKKIPLSFYHDKSWNIIRNDALDRFGTPLEQRFNKKEIASMMEASGLKDIKFSNNPPYWHAVGRKA